MYAIISVGGKQFRVQKGDSIFVEKLQVEDGTELRFDAMMISRDDGITVGAPYVPGASVTGIVRGQVKSKKIVVYKYKAKKNERKKQGHRQPYTKVEIAAIEG